MRAVLLLCLTLAVSNSRQSPNVEPMPHQLKEGDQQIVDEYIVGGVDAQLGQVPFMALLVRLDTRSPICGGVIVSNRYILTTASCVYGVVPRNLAVYVGGVALDGSISSPDAKVIAVLDLRVHPAYNSATNDYDIAVIKVPEQIVFSRYVLPASVGIFEPAVGDDVTVAGWGPTKKGGPFSNVLRVVNLTIVSTDTCQKSYGEDTITKRMICAYTKGKDVCKGDTGGPMFVGNVTRGLISFGGDCSGNYLSVFTKIGEYISWLDTVTEYSIDIMI